MFDSYWNHETALPVPAFLKPLEDPESELKQLRERLEAAQSEVRQSRYAEAVIDRILEQVETDLGAFEWAPYKLVYDSPDKGVKTRAGDATLLKDSIRDSILAAQQEVIIVSPYFVPRKSGVESIRNLRDRGISVTVITNSLAANNQASVHGGYAPSRKPLLEAGVRLYEVSPDAEVPGTEFVDASGARATLHTKAYMVDRSQIFIGSFNFDPRSANINTEMGVIIEDRELASYFADRIDAALPISAFEVFLNDAGKIRWRDRRRGEDVIWTKEPETTWGQRFMATFYRILPIRGQL